MSRIIALAYSGGLDTSIIVPWLREHYPGSRVICVAADIGQGDELEGVREKALASGADDCHVEDLREEFVRDYVFPTLRAGAIYNRNYLLGTSMARPVIAKAQVDVARRVGADALAHGCTGKGNDQVRFEVTAMALAPEITVEAPIREWGLSREASIAWAQERGIPIPVRKASPYSIDENLWGRTAECGILEDPWAEPPEEVYERTRALTNTPDEPDEVTIGFVDGLPVSLDGKELDLRSLVAELDQRAGAHGVGRIDMIEDRLVGIKSREIYECPGAVTVLTAHRDLEDLCMEQELAQEKRTLEGRYAQLIYNGLWFTPLKTALDAFMASSQRFVRGDVRLRLFKGSATVIGRRSDIALYDHDLATYDEADRFDHTQAVGFVRLWGLPTKVWSRRQGDIGAG